MASYSHARDWKGKLHRELAKDLRDKDRAKLKALRTALAEAKVSRSRALKEIVRRCCAAKAKARERRLQAKESYREARETVRATSGTCAAERATLRLAGVSLSEQRRAYEDARKDYRESRTSLRAAPSRHTSSEAKAESAEAVEANLDADMVPVWRAVRSTIKARPGISRTEAFLQWAHDSPGEVWSIRNEQTEKAVVALKREERAHYAAMKAESRYQRSPEKLAADLAAVPF